MKRSKANGLCCGAGGAQMFKDAEPGNKEINVERTEDALETKPEIIAEGVDHQLFYEKTGTLNAFTYGTASSNFDVNGKPIGLQSVFTTTGAASGTLKITLKHLPNKSGVNVAAGDITNAFGNTDVEIIFNLTVQ